MEWAQYQSASENNSTYCVQMEIGMEKGPTPGVRSAPKMDPP